MVSRGLFSSVWRPTFFGYGQSTFSTKLAGIGNDPELVLVGEKMTICFVSASDTHRSFFSLFGTNEGLKYYSWFQEC